MIRFGREITSKPEVSGRREWLVTNGIGGYAMGTVNLTRTRTYHGYLVAATQPPTKRVVLLAALDTWLDLEGYSIPLVTHEWATGVLFPDGYNHLESFYLDGLLPVWEWAYRDVKFTQHLWMPHGKNTTYITYTYTRGECPVKLTIKPLVTYRNHHHTAKGGSQVHVTPIQWEGGKGVDILPVSNLSSRAKEELENQPAPFKILTNASSFNPKGDWWWKFHLATEKYRGQADVEDLYQAGVIEHTFKPGDTLCIVASMDNSAVEEWASSLYTERIRQKELRQRNQLDEAPEWIQQLGLAADQFIVERKIDDVAGKTILAGYPWFTDWGRDTMIALPGLMLATRRYKEAAQTLQTFSRYVDMGMLPNRFPDTDIAPEYNTADATLWYFVAIYEYLQVNRDLELATELYPILSRIIEWHKRGTRYHIGMDRADHLLKQGEPNIQLTWMDVKVDDWVVTPRHGKAVEVNALWYNALRIMGWLSKFLGKDPAHFIVQAEMVQVAFQEKFWYAGGGYLYDVIETPTGNDATIRPNQLFAVSLPFPLIEGEKAKSILNICGKHLLGSYGLRSLSPDHNDYIGTYGGDVKKRDAAYHQGTMWAWLMGTFVTAHWRVYQDAQQAMNYLRPFADQLFDDGLGSIGEIFDGNPPHNPRGCPFQAWSVAEILRCYRELEKAP